MTILTQIESGHLKKIETRLINVEGYLSRTFYEVKYYDL